MRNYTLPVTYGKSRLVVLPVNPYLIHAYWEVVPADLARATKQAGPAQPVLRFYKSGETASETTDWFDIEIDLSARNRYVDLWSAEEAYHADLGLKTGDGTLVRLAGSQVVRMPRAVPHIGIDQHFMKVEDAKSQPEIAAPPAPKPVPTVPEVRPRSSHSRPVTFAETFKATFRKLYASLRWHRHGVRLEHETPNVTISTRISATTLTPAEKDLTTTAERNLVVGVSSSSRQNEEDGHNNK